MAKQQKGPKGWFVNPPKEIKEMILTRCQESMRVPNQEIIWILRDWMRTQETLDERSEELDKQLQEKERGL